MVEFRELILLFKDPSNSGVFNGCDQAFINAVVTNMAYNFFTNGVIIQSANHDAEEIFFVLRGGVAVCEPYCFKEPILIYQPGAVINLYQSIMNRTLDFHFMTVSPNSFSTNAGTVSYDESSKLEYF